ncbi:DUF6764 family protein [Nocardia macrotermitis]|uniref:Protein kinase n=1 Tax=Nocardia macrotermitis TaxID=2585198 RepID=A0A7K0DAX6_9NOCA|nr:DUF6764 family protein [Nocardia macrotermitis]MQY22945.1 hypothetical protein [Nocardia macrotermitis]
MKVVSVVGVSAVVVGVCLCGAGNASATQVQCDSDGGRDITVVAGNTACRAAVGGAGHARAVGLDGIGFAQAGAGAVALGLGVSGGIGASEGTAGVPIAIGVGPEAYAFTSLHDATGPGVSFAMNGSLAQVISDSHTVTCLGSAALAWDSRTGSGCLATPVGLWRTATPPR